MADIVVEFDAVPARKSRVRRRQYSGYFWVGGAIVGLLIAVSLFAPWMTRVSPNAMDVVANLLPIGSPGHPLGTDNYGRDMLTRLMYGGRTTLLAGIFSSLISTLVGVALGMLAGYSGRKTDVVIMRALDVLMSFPFILMAILIVAIAGPSTLHALLAIAVANVPFFARIIRGEVIKLKASEYITVAKTFGAGHFSILTRHMLPNILPYVLSTLFMNVGWMISQTSSLSFLGFGTQPPTADWGSMLAEAQSYMAIQPAIGILPGVMICIAVVGFNLFGIGLKTALTPEGK